MEIDLICIWFLSSSTLDSVELVIMLFLAQFLTYRLNFKVIWNHQMPLVEA